MLDRHSRVTVPALIYEQELEDNDNAVGYINANYINVNPLFLIKFLLLYNQEFIIIGI